MVQMTMCQPDPRQGQSQLANRLLQAGSLATGIDERRLMSFIAPEQGAVLHELGDGHYLILEHMNSCT